MKLTNLALIFVVILFPIIVIVYVNTSFVVKSEKEEMYYKNVMDSAIKDATSQMKQVENNDLQIDYGYSGEKNNKVSVNAGLAISTFYSSLFNNFGISGNRASEDYLKSYIPCIAIFDYDGVYIHSAEEDSAGDISFVTKPKQYYTYAYGIEQKGTLGSYTYDVIDITKITSGTQLIKNTDNNPYIFEVTYTMDEDYIYLDTYCGNGNVISKDKFYYTNSNNQNFVKNITGIVSDTLELLKEKIIKKVQEKRKETICEITMNAVSYAVNAHNTYAKSLGIDYEFSFTTENVDSWYETINGIGMFAMVQGISLGNKYLNYKAYSISGIVLSKKYYLSSGITDISVADTYLSHKLYHISKECPVYKEFVYRMLNDSWVISPKFYLLKSEAAENGYSPCPICKP